MSLSVNILYGVLEMWCEMWVFLEVWEVRYADAGQIAIPPVPMASAPQPSSTGVRWRGMLAKSGSPVCSMICTTESSSSGDGKFLRHPFSQFFHVLHVPAEIFSMDGWMQ